MSETLRLLTLLGFGFIAGIRHGIDIDHIAAITDITSSQKRGFLALLYAVLYGLGHGLMVIGLGVLVLTLGTTLPKNLDLFFGKIVGATLIFLGLYVLFSILRQGRNFKMKSRWMLIFGVIKYGYHKFLHKLKFSHHHPKLVHEQYAPTTAFTIGIIHGIGAETPTQIGAFLVLLGIGRGVISLFFLFSFVLGIFASNILVALLSLYGYKKSINNQNIYLAVGLITALFSLFAGILFLKGVD